MIQTKITDANVRMRALGPLDQELSVWLMVELNMKRETVKRFGNGKDDIMVSRVPGWEINNEN